MLVLVIGGSGFVGTRLLTQLSSHSYQVRATSRTSRPATPEIDWRLLDLTQSGQDLTSLFKDVDVVIHLASLAHDIDGHASDQIYYRVNVEGTQKILDACVQNGVKRLIYLSSIKVLGDGSNSGTKSEVYTDDSRPKPVGIYGQSKLQAEEIIRGACDSASLNYAILRPPLVYGAGVKANFYNLMSCVLKRLPLPFGRIDNQRSLISLDNLCDAIIRCVQHKENINDTFLISDTIVSTPDLISEIAKQVGIKPLLLPVPLFMLKTLAFLGGKGSALNKIAGSQSLDDTRFRQIFNWSPPQSFQDGIRETVQAYMSDNDLKVNS